MDKGEELKRIIIKLLCLIFINCNKYTNVVEYLVKKSGSDEKIKYEKQEDIRLGLLLTEASKKNEIKGVKEALSKGANINYKGSDGKTALMHAVANDNGHSLVNILLKKEADISEVSIFDAIKNKHFKLAKLLITEGHADVNCADNVEKTVLMYAIESYDKSLVKLAIEKGANLNNLEKYIMNAIKGGYGCFEIVKLLIENGLNVNSKDENGNTLLIYILYLDSLSLDFNNLKFLLENNSDPNIQNNKGISPLMIAASKGICHRSKLLLSKGADPNLIDKLGNTALIRLIDNIDNIGFFDGYDMTSLLLEAGADITIKNNSGNTALTIIMKQLNKAAQSSPLIRKVKDKSPKLFSRKLKILNLLLKEGHYKTIDLNILLKGENGQIENFVLLEAILNVLIKNQRTSQLLFYENNSLNIPRTLHILENFSSFTQDLKIEIIEHLNINKIFSSDNFLMKNKNLLMESFFNVTKLFKLEELNIVKR